MKIEKNSRQMPSSFSIVQEKNYCDLLYAWLQCNSERENYNTQQRVIPKSKIRWVNIEKDFTRTLDDGTTSKTMSRQTIAKYFSHLEQKGLIKLEGEFYRLTVLDPMEANLIEYNTLVKLMNVFQKHSLNIYMYVLNRYFANAEEKYSVSFKEIKNFIGITDSTTSNNGIVADTLDILRRLGLIDYSKGPGGIVIEWAINCLPDI